MSTEDILNHGQRIAAIERKVAESKDAVDRLAETYGQ